MWRGRHRGKSSRLMMLLCIIAVTISLLPSGATTVWANPDSVAAVAEDGGAVADDAVSAPEDDGTVLPEADDGAQDPVEPEDPAKPQDAEPEDTEPLQQDPEDAEPEDADDADADDEPYMEVMLQYYDQTPAKDGAPVYTYCKDAIGALVYIEPHFYTSNPTNFDVQVKVPSAWVSGHNNRFNQISSASATQFSFGEIYEEDGYYIFPIHFDVFDITQTLTLQFNFSLKNGVVPADAATAVTVEATGDTEFQVDDTPLLYYPKYDTPSFSKYLGKARRTGGDIDGQQIYVTLDSDTLSDDKKTIHALDGQELAYVFDISNRNTERT